MTKGETSSTFEPSSQMSAEESYAFDRWLINNAVIGSVFAAGIVAIILVGPSRPSVPAGANSNSPASEFSASARAE